MSKSALVECATAELIESGLSKPDALAAAWHISSNPNSALAAATMVSTARAIGRLPQGPSWWTTAEATLPKARLLGGEQDYVWVAVAEQLAEPADDCWDPNWPTYKASKALLRRDAAAGDVYVVGNGEGQRGRVKVVSRAGTLEAVITESWFAFGDLWDEAVREAESIGTD